MLSSIEKQTLIAKSIQRSSVEINPAQSRIKIKKHMEEVANGDTFEACKLHTTQLTALKLAIVQLA